MGEEYRTAPRFLTFQPPDGDYIEYIENVSIKFIGKPSDRQAAVLIDGRIADGDYEGKKNSLGVFTNKNLGMLADVLDALNEPEQGDPLSAANAVKKHIGELVQVKVETRPDKKGVPRTNAKIIGLVPGGNGVEAMSVETAPEVEAAPDFEPEPSA